MCGASRAAAGAASRLGRDRDRRSAPRRASRCPGSARRSRSSPLRRLIVESAMLQRVSPGRARWVGCRERRALSGPARVGAHRSGGSPWRRGRLTKVAASAADARARSADAGEGQMPSAIRAARRSMTKPPRARPRRPAAHEQPRHEPAARNRKPRPPRPPTRGRTTRRGCRAATHVRGLGGVGCRQRGRGQPGRHRTPVRRRPPLRVHRLGGGDPAGPVGPTGPA